MCDQHWVQNLAEAKSGDEVRYQGVIKVALEKRIQLRTMDWAVQCFIEAKVIDPESCPRFLVNWPKGHQGSKKTSPSRYPEDLFWFKLAKERYEVGDVVKMSPPSDKQPRGTSPGSASAKRTSRDVKFQYGRIKRITIESSADKLPTVHVQILEQANAADRFELTSKAGATGVEAARLKGKIVLLDRANYLKYINYTVSDSNVFHRPSTRSEH